MQPAPAAPKPDLTPSNPPITFEVDATPVVPAAVSTASSSVAAPASAVPRRVGPARAGSAGARWCPPISVPSQLPVYPEAVKPALASRLFRSHCRTMWRRSCWSARRSRATIRATPSRRCSTGAPSKNRSARRSGRSPARLRDLRRHGPAPRHQQTRGLRGGRSRHRRSRRSAADRATAAGSCSCHLSGDRFTVYVPHTTLAQARRIAEQLSKSVSAGCRSKCTRVPTPLSISFRRGADSLDAKADWAMRSPLPKRPAKPPRIAAAGASRCIRTRIRASSVATTTCWSPTACARRSTTGASKCSRSRSSAERAELRARALRIVDATDRRCRHASVAGVVHVGGHALSHAAGAGSRRARSTCFGKLEQTSRGADEEEAAVLGESLRPLHRRSGFPRVARHAHRRRRRAGRMAAVRDHRNRGGRERGADAGDDPAAEGARRSVRARRFRHGRELVRLPQVLRREAC